jgi:hypothetical protein
MLGDTTGPPNPALDPPPDVGAAGAGLLALDGAGAAVFVAVFVVVFGRGDDVPDDVGAVGAVAPDVTGDHPPLPFSKNVPLVLLPTTSPNPRDSNSAAE